MNGGFDAWTKAGYETETLSESPKNEKGNWHARDCRHKNITFEELTEKDGKDKDILEKTDQFNILDTRLRVHFNNEQDTGLDGFGRMDSIFQMILTICLQLSLVLIFLELIVFQVMN